MSIPAGGSDADLIMEGIPQGLNEPLQSDEQLSAMNEDQLVTKMNKAQTDLMNVLSAFGQMSSRETSRHVDLTNEFKRRKTIELNEVQRQLNEKSTECRRAMENFEEIHETYKRDRNAHNEMVQKVSGNLKEIYHEFEVIKDMMKEDAGANWPNIEGRYKEIFELLHIRLFGLHDALNDPGSKVMPPASPTMPGIPKPESLSRPAPAPKPRG